MVGVISELIFRKLSIFLASPRRAGDTHGPNGWLGDNSQFQRKLMHGTLVWGARSMLKPRNSWVPVVTQEK